MTSLTVILILILSICLNQLDASIHDDFFQLYDLNKDGQIAREEFDQMIVAKLLEVERENPDRHNLVAEGVKQMPLSEIFEGVDSDRNGLISVKEYTAAKDVFDFFDQLEMWTGQEGGGGEDEEGKQEQMMKEKEVPEETGGESKVGKEEEEEVNGSGKKENSGSDNQPAGRGAEVSTPKDGRAEDGKKDGGEDKAEL